MQIACTGCLQAGRPEDLLQNEPHHAEAAGEGVNNFELHRAGLRLCPFLLGKRPKPGPEVGNWVGNAFLQKRKRA
jgi:hypothetical protein